MIGLTSDVHLLWPENPNKNALVMKRDITVVLLFKESASERHPISPSF